MKTAKFRRSDPPPRPDRRVAVPVVFRKKSRLIAGMAVGGALAVTAGVYIAGPARGQDLERDVPTTAADEVTEKMPLSGGWNAQPTIGSGEIPSDEEILRRLPELSTQYAADLLTLYERLGNLEMAGKLRAEILARDPEYFQRIQAQEAARQTPADRLAVFEDEVSQLMASGEFEEAVVALEQLKRSEYAAKPFPLELMLADAYAESGDFERARQSYGFITRQEAYTPAARREAESRLASMQYEDQVRAAYDEISAGHGATALRLASKLRKVPDATVEVELLYGQALVAAGHYQQGAGVLRALRDGPYAGQTFPAQASLAEAMEALGRLGAAQDAYEAMRVDPNVNPRDAIEAEKQSLELRKYYMGKAEADTEYISEDEGEGWLSAVDASYPVSETWRIGSRAYYENVSLSADRIVEAGSGDNFSAEAYVRHRFEDYQYFEGSGGGSTLSEAQVRGGVAAGIERFHPSRWGYRVSLNANERAIDSLQLIALEGYEHRASVSGDGPLGYWDLQVATGGYYRKVYAEDAELGSGYGGYLDLSRTVVSLRQGNFVTRAGYHGDYYRFDANELSASDLASLRLTTAAALQGSRIGESLIDPRIHEHGFYISVENNFSDELCAYVTGSFVYDADTEEPEYRVSAGISYSLTETAELNVEGAYYSDGLTPGNEASGVVVGSVGVLVYY